MDQDDRRETRTLWGGTTTVGAALVVAAVFLGSSTLWEARGFDSAVGEVLGTRAVDTPSGPRPELLVGYQTAGGDTIMFAEAVGPLAPAVGDQVTVWYRVGNAPKAMVARQRFVWPVLLLPVGLLLSAFGIWRLRRARTVAAMDFDIELEDV